MARRVKIKQEEILADGVEAVEFELRGRILTSVQSLPVRSLLLLGQIIEASASVETEEDSAGGVEAFVGQYNLVLSLLAPDSRPVFEDIVENSNPPLDANELASITKTLMEELMSGKADTTSQGSLDTTPTTKEESTGLSFPQGTPLLTNFHQTGS